MAGEKGIQESGALMSDYIEREAAVHHVIERLGALPLHNVIVNARLQMLRKYRDYPVVDALCECLVDVVAECNRRLTAAVEEMVGYEGRPMVFEFHPPSDPAAREAARELAKKFTKGVNAGQVTSMPRHVVDSRIVHSCGWSQRDGGNFCGGCGASLLKANLTLDEAAQKIRRANNSMLPDPHVDAAAARAQVDIQEYVAKRLLSLESACKAFVAVFDAPIQERAKKMELAMNAARDALDCGKSATVWGESHIGKWFKEWWRRPEYVAETQNRQPSADDEFRIMPIEPPTAKQVAEFQAMMYGEWPSDSIGVQIARDCRAAAKKIVESTETVGGALRKKLGLPEVQEQDNRVIGVAIEDSIPHPSGKGWSVKVAVTPAIGNGWSTSKSTPLDDIKAIKEKVASGEIPLFQKPHVPIAGIDYPASLAKNGDEDLPVAEFVDAPKPKE